MVVTTSKWEDELVRWLKPFLDRLGHKARRRMCPLYISGLIGPGDRKSVQPMAARLAPGEYDQLHHFIADGLWDSAPLEAELLVQADRLVGDKDAVLVIDDTAMPKKGDRSVGVAPQYASSLGKTANCQTLVSLTLARGEVPVMVALRSSFPRVDRLRIPPASPSRTSGAEKKSTVLRLSRGGRPYAKQSSISSSNHDLSDARTAEDKSAESSSVNKSAKVVLGPVDTYRIHRMMAARVTTA